MLENKFQKIIKTIALLSFIVCSILNTNVTFATNTTRATLFECRCERSIPDFRFGNIKYGDYIEWTDYDHNARKVQTYYASHDLLKFWLERNDKKWDDMRKGATVLAGAASGIGLAFGPIGKIVGFVTGGVIEGGTALARAFDDHDKEWVGASISRGCCGVKIHNLKNSFGRWYYYNYEPL